MDARLPEGGTKARPKSTNHTGRGTLRPRGLGELQLLRSAAKFEI